MHRPCAHACRPQTTLVDYHLGYLPPNEQEEIAEHLAACPSCAALLDDVVSRSAHARAVVAAALIQPQPVDVDDEPDAPRPARRPLPRRLLIGAAASLAVAAALGAAVYHFGFRTGELSVLTDEFNVSLVIARDGERVAIVDLRSATRVPLKPGRYTLSVEGRDDVELLDREVTVERGESRPVRLRYSPRSLFVACLLPILPRAGELAALPHPADRASRRTIPREMLARAGRGNPESAPPELVAVLADLRAEAASPVTCLTFNREGSLLYSGAEDGAVCVWDVAAGRSRLLGSHAGAVRQIALAPCGKLLASCAEEGVRLWDLAKINSTRTLAGTGDASRGLTFSPDGRGLATVGSDGALRVWRVTNGELAETISGRPDAFRCASWSGDGACIACGDDVGGVVVHRFGERRERRLVGRHAGGVGHVLYLPDGKLASAGDDGFVRVWDAAAGRLLAEHKVHDGELSSLCSCAGGRLLATSAGGVVRLWRLGDSFEEGPAWALASLEKPSRTAALSCEGRYFAAGNADGTIYLMRVADRPERRAER